MEGRLACKPSTLSLLGWCGDAWPWGGEGGVGELLAVVLGKGVYGLASMVNSHAVRVGIVSALAGALVSAVGVMGAPGAAVAAGWAWRVACAAVKVGARRR